MGRRGPDPSGGLRVLRCIIFIPSGPEFARWSQICAAYCLNHHYVVVAVTQVWSTAVEMMASGQVAVAVIAKRDHLPPERLPRLEVVAEEQADTPAVPPTQRRPLRRT